MASSTLPHLGDSIFQISRLREFLIQNKGLNGKWQLNEGRKYCRMLQEEHSAILLTCIKR